MYGARPAISLSLELDTAAIYRVYRSDEVEDRRLSGAVGADEAHDLLLAHFEIQIGEDVEAAEVLVDLVKYQKRVSSCHALPPRRGRPAPLVDHDRGHRDEATPMRHQVQANPPKTTRLPVGTRSPLKRCKP